MNILSILILLVLALSLSGESTEKLLCEEVGVCETCRGDEVRNEYCKDTARRIRIHCKDNQSEFDDFKSCDRTAEDEQLRVIIFQVTMAVCGGLAYWAVQARKKNTMTQFDHRKMGRRQQV